MPLKLDLNLLKVFDAVMSEMSLTKAAKRLKKTQSAVSHSMERLRKVTGDRLYDRTGHGIRPTPRAQEMAKEVRRALTIVQGAMEQGSSFDPASEERSFLIDIPIGFDWVLAPLLADKLQTLPNITLQISNARAANLLNELRYRETWLALDYTSLSAAGYRAETLLDDRLVFVTRADHPRFVRGFDIAALKSIGQVGIGWSTLTSPVNHPVDERIGEAGLGRHVRLWVPTLASMFATIEASDLGGFAVRCTARAFASAHKLAIYEIPVKMRSMPMVMVWHETFDKDPGHRWLRDTIREISRDIG